MPAAHTSTGTMVHHYSIHGQLSRTKHTFVRSLNLPEQKGFAGLKLTGNSWDTCRSKINKSFRQLFKRAVFDMYITHTTRGRGGVHEREEASTVCLYKNIHMLCRSWNWCLTARWFLVWVLAGAFLGARCPCTWVGFLWVLQLHPTVQRHAC